MTANTLNLCLGHTNFPQQGWDAIDLMLSPVVLKGPKKIAWIPDNNFGLLGHTLSEYAQLIWVYRHLDTLMNGYEYLRIFHYRRFCSQYKPSIGKTASNMNWSTVIQAEELIYFKASFDRTVSQEWFNTRVMFDGGVLRDYLRHHIYDDFIHFVRYLVEEKIIDYQQAFDFLTSPINIPACNIGVFHIETFREIFCILEKAIGFLQSSRFIERSDYQRRNMGFLLERLHGFLLQQRVQLSISNPIFGFNMVISQSLNITQTDYIPEKY